MKVAVFALSLPLFLSACGSSDHEESNSKIVQNQIGRFTIVPAQSDYPAIVLDTATGCVMTVEKADGQIRVDEVSFVDNTNSCNAEKQLPVVDTFRRIVK